MLPTNSRELVSSSQASVSSSQVFVLTPQAALPTLQLPLPSVQTPLIAMQTVLTAMQSRRHFGTNRYLSVISVSPPQRTPRDIPDRRTRAQSYDPQRAFAPLHSRYMKIWPRYTMNATNPARKT